MADDQVTPQPDDRSPAEREAEIVEKHQRELLRATTELAGRELLLHTIRANRRADQDELYDAAVNYRNAETAFNVAKNQLVNAIKTHIKLASEEKTK
jgi:hypothetical protein